MKSRNHVFFPQKSGVLQWEVEAFFRPYREVFGHTTGADDGRKELSLNVLHSFLRTTAISHQLMAAKLRVLRDSA